MNSVTKSTRLSAVFEKLQQQNRAALVTFITAGDPDIEISQRILNGLPAAGADIIELGMAFSDPMADGPAIQLANQRALANGISVRKTLAMVHEFRQQDAHTPIILMGYYNPIYQYGVDTFLKDAEDAGIDGLIIVDLPPEEDNELCLPCQESMIHWVRLTTPTSDAQRLEKVLRHSSGFVYHVSIAGITGTKTAESTVLEQQLAEIRAQTDLPIAIGFGIKTREHVTQTAQLADAVVVGSAIIQVIADHLEDKAALADNVHQFVSELAKGCAR